MEHGPTGLLRRIIETAAESSSRWQTCSATGSSLQQLSAPWRDLSVLDPVRAHDHGRERASPPAGSSCTATSSWPGRAQIDTNLPADSVTVTHWYKQSVYDPADNKIGEIMDVLVDRDGKVTVLIVGVGGFLGLGEKDVAVPFNSVRATTKDNNTYYLVMNSTKDALKSASRRTSSGV